ncbi:hypothetical protein ACFP3U_18140 [Kitasatospora misakiensis]|uniref:Uncharacterized protein n=1 Tax=Kitasatospora misakiensis TaxID=67330 RepID=A0ABW0X376_9ACTN
MQVCVARGLGVPVGVPVPDGGAVDVEGGLGTDGGAVAGALLGAGGAGGAEAGVLRPGVPPVADVGAPPFPPAGDDGAADPEAGEDEPDAEGVLLAGGWVAEEVGAGADEAEDACGCAEAPSGDPAVTDGPVAASAGISSDPFATSAAAPSPTTATPSTDITSRPGRRWVRRTARREPARPSADPPPSTAASGASDGGRTASGPSGPGGARSSGPVAGAPQPGQARAPFRWRRQGAQ